MSDSTNEVLNDIDKALDGIDRLKQYLQWEIDTCPEYESRQDMLVRRGRQQLAQELLRKYFNES